MKKPLVLIGAFICFLLAGNLAYQSISDYFRNDRVVGQYDSDPSNDGNSYQVKIFTISKGRWIKTGLYVTDNNSVYVVARENRQPYLVRVGSYEVKIDKPPAFFGMICVGCFSDEVQREIEKLNPSDKGVLPKINGTEEVLIRVDDNASSDEMTIEVQAMYRK